MYKIRTHGFRMRAQSSRGLPFTHWLRCSAAEYEVARSVPDDRAFLRGDLQKVPVVAIDEWELTELRYTQNLCGSLNYTAPLVALCARK